MNAAEMKKQLVGRTIVAVTPRAFRTGRPGRNEWSYEPIFMLDDGSRVRFVVDETESGDGYGVTPCRDVPSKEGES